MKISNRINRMNYSPIRKLLPYAKEAEAKGVKVYRLNIGQPSVVTPDSFFEGVDNYKEKIVKYADSQGIPELIDSFIMSYKKWDIELERDEIMITHGGSEAILFSIMAICDEGDEILVPEPFYSNYSSFAHMAGVKVVPIKTTIENGFHLPSKYEIEELITTKTRAFLFCNPVNPTGTVYTREELDMLAELAEEHGLFIISDEVYREFVFDEDVEYTSCMYLENVKDRVLLIDSISKHYSACGARIGLVTSKNKDIINQILKLCQARLSVSTIEQHAASNLINTMSNYFEDVKDKYALRRNIMYDYMSKIPGIKCFRPSATFYIFAELPIEDTEDFAKWMLTDYSYEGATLMFAPGNGFFLDQENEGRNMARFSFCTSVDDIENSMIILKRGLEKYKEEKGLV